MGQVTWTPEIVEMLKDMVEKGCSTAIISEELSSRFGVEISRNAVIGKIHRLKIENQKKPTIVREWKPNTMSQNKLSPPKPKRSPPKPLKVYINQLDSVSALGMCRYPDRDDAGVAIYCGLPTMEIGIGKCSWCSWHHAIVTVVARV